MSSGITTTNFISSDGSDIGIQLVEKDYLRRVYPGLADQFITPELWVWGSEYNGRLGNNNDSSSYATTPITTFAGGSNWKTISSGPGPSVSGFMAAIKTDGSLWMWGFQGAPPVGALGTNTTVSISTPVTTISGGNDWKQISLGVAQASAIKTDGSLWSWGTQNSSVYSARGGLGVNDIVNRSSPVTTFAGGDNWASVSCGTKNIVALKNDGSLWNWGSGILTPVTTIGLNSKWKVAHSTASDTILAIKNDGSLWVIGENGKGQLGVNDTTDRLETPVTTFAGGNNWAQVTSSTSTSQWSAVTSEIYATKTDGSLWTWGGDNSYLTPVTTLVGGNDWRIIRDGYAVKTNGTLWKLNPYTPTQFDSSNNWKIASNGIGIKTIDDV